MTTAAQIKPQHYYRPHKKCWPLFVCQEIKEYDPTSAQEVWYNQSFTMRCKVCGTTRGPFLDGDRGM